MDIERVKQHKREKLNPWCYGCQCIGDLPAAEVMCDFAKWTDD